MMFLNSTARDDEVKLAACLIFCGASAIRNDKAPITLFNVDIAANNQAWVVFAARNIGIPAHRKSAPNNGAERR